MHKPPKKLKKGWSLHRKAYNELLDYVKKTRPIPENGHTETSNGTMPPVFPQSISHQFSPSIGEGYSPSLSISPGYVFASFRDPDLTADAHLPQIQQWAFEPKVNSDSGKFLSDDSLPSITLNKNNQNYIYLKIEWTANKYDIGGHTYESAYAFQADYNLKDQPNDHIIIDGDSSEAPPPPGIHTRIDKVFYTYKTSYFINQYSQQPDAETELVTYIPCGLINLDADGLIIEDSSPQRDGFIWFLQGPIFAHRPPNYITGTSSPDRTEPIAPVQADNYRYPGAELDT